MQDTAAAGAQGRDRKRILGTFLANLGIDRKRPDVAEHHGDPRLLRTGFRGAVPEPSDPKTFSDRHRVFAIMLRGVAVELPSLARPDPPR